MIFASKMRSSDIFERSARIQWKKVEDQVVIIDRAEGEMVHFNDLGTQIWAKLTGEMSVQEIVSEISREFDAPMPVLEKDVMKFVRELLKMELVKKKD